MIPIDLENGVCRRLWTSLARDRTFKTLGLAAILIVLMGSLRPDRPRGLYEKRYWATKISWRHCADIVLTGDSRVLGGVSPAEMRKTLGDRRIVNYAFASNLYTPEYLDAVEQVLDPESSDRVILLGITPHSLTEDPDVTGQFTSLKGLSRRQIYVDIHLAPLLSFFDYMSFGDALKGLFPSLAGTRTQRELWADGWLAYDRQPPGEKKELKKYARMYQKSRVSSKMVDDLNAFVARWTGMGIRVYAFLMPSCREMADLEEQYSGFDQRRFVEDFARAGGTWIDADPRRHDSFDGSHLGRQAALEFSRELAGQIHEMEQHWHAPASGKGRESPVPHATMQRPLRTGGSLEP
ncbi:MAG: hypothetical protein ABFE13_25260 [Phycisphaerales bacterium]